MKKFFKTLAIVLCFSMFAPSVVPNVAVETVEAKTQISKKKQKSLEKKAERCLDIASEDCKEVMNTIYNSWYFQVYKAGNYHNSYILTPYSKATGIPESEVKRIIGEIYGREADEYDIPTAIQILETNIDIVMKYYYEQGTYDEIYENLSNAKNYIKQLPNKKSKKKLLQKYYNATNKYYKFVKSPSGSFSELNNKRDSFNEKVDDCKEELSW